MKMNDAWAEERYGIWACEGSVRGRCMRRHYSLETAERHVAEDARGCETAGGYSDRQPVMVVPPRGQIIKRPAGGYELIVQRAGVIQYGPKDMLLRYAAKSRISVGYVAD